MSPSELALDVIEDNQHGGVITWEWIEAGWPDAVQDRAAVVAAFRAHLRVLRRGDCVRHPEGCDCGEWDRDELPELDLEVE